MKPKTASGTIYKIMVKRAESSGRILYDNGSILESDAAKRHLDSLRKIFQAGGTEHNPVSVGKKG